MAQFSFRISKDILKENCAIVNSKNVKIEICINKNVFDIPNNLSINDLLENIRILFKYILSRKTKKVKLKNNSNKQNQPTKKTIQTRIRGSWRGEIDPIL